MALFWMNEQSGQMRIIVEKFMKQEKLAPFEFNILKSYIAQWIKESIIPEDLALKILNIDSQKELSKYLIDLLEYGIDPF